MLTKREKVQEYILQLMDDIDPSGDNTERYKKLFKKMSSKDFDTYMKNIRDGKTQIFAYMPNGLSKATSDHMVKIAKKREVPIFTKIWFRDSHSGRRYPTKYPMLVVDLPVRRLSQYLFHKISLPESDGRINPVTGQVIPPDKGAAISMVETQILASKGLETSIVEPLKIRGGDVNAYRAMVNTIEETGEVSLTDLPLENRPRSAITAKMYLHAMQIDTNL